jgi:dihydroorotate dehydrogenase electron transfer subunit
MSADGPLLDERARDAPARSRTLAPFGRRALTVTANEPLGAYRVLKVADPHGPAPQAGQFAMLAATERWGAGEDERPYLPRAFSYARFRDGEAHFLLEDVGPGTKRLCELREGDELWVLGPLGNGFTAPMPEHDAIPEGDRRALLVGGGVGIAPLAILRDRLVSTGPAGSAGRAREARPIALLGFRDRAHAEGADLVVPRKPSGDAGTANNKMLVATDDGSVGHHGLVTELLREQLDRDAPSGAQAHATVYACGPPPMLEAVRALCAERSVPAQLALEAGMACGFGACYGCVVPKRDGGYLRVCVDGPVVDATELERVQ